VAGAGHNDGPRRGTGVSEANRAYETDLRAVCRCLVLRTANARACGLVWVVWPLALGDSLTGPCGCPPSPVEGDTSTAPVTFAPVAPSLSVLCVLLCVAWGGSGTRRQAGG
jgi:hypothetical protein